MTLLTFPTTSRRTSDDLPPNRTLLVRPESDARYYNDEAQPVLRVPYADPKRRGETRPVTLADARKLGLFPSVTNVISLLDRPSLRAWQSTQYILSALTLPRLPGESDDDFALRVVDDGEAERRQAADEGSELHDAIASYLMGERSGLYQSDWSQHMRAFDAWWSGSGFRCLDAEHRFVNREHGYAGMVDCVATTSHAPESYEDLVIIDWKSQKTAPGKKVTFYDEWAMQLAAYAHTPGIRLVSVVISRTEPGRIELKEWGDRDRWWACYHAALCLWKLRVDYYPGK